jgi:hypothetical protein
LHHPDFATAWQETTWQIDPVQFNRPIGPEIVFARGAIQLAHN